MSKLESVKAYKREPKSCLGKGYNFKFGCFVVMLAPLFGVYTCPLLEL